MQKYIEQHSSENRTRKTCSAVNDGIVVNAVEIDYEQWIDDSIVVVVSVAVRLNSIDPANDENYDFRYDSVAVVVRYLGYTNFGNLMSQRYRQRESLRSNSDHRLKKVHLLEKNNISFR